MARLVEDPTGDPIYEPFGGNPDVQLEAEIALREALGKGLPPHLVSYSLREPMGYEAASRRYDPVWLALMVVSGAEWIHAPAAADEIEGVREVWPELLELEPGWGLILAVRHKIYGVHVRCSTD